jgi:predicted transcriptional regulator
MDVRTRVREISNEIIDVLEKEPLSFQELSRRVHENDEKLSQDIDNLVHAGVVGMRFRNHRVLYTLKHHQFRYY